MMITGNTLAQDGMVMFNRNLADIERNNVGDRRSAALSLLFSVALFVATKGASGIVKKIAGGIATVNSAISIANSSINVALMGIQADSSLSNAERMEKKGDILRSVADVGGGAMFVQTPTGTHVLGVNLNTPNATVRLAGVERELGLCPRIAMGILSGGSNVPGYTIVRDFVTIPEGERVEFANSFRGVRDRNQEYLIELFGDSYDPERSLYYLPTYIINEIFRLEELEGLQR
jgi:hypothetical protein